MTSSDIISLYSSPQSGGDLPYFIGKQYGSGWLQTLGRFAFPILKKLGGVAVKHVSRAAKDVMVDNKPILPTLKAHAKEALGIMPSPPPTPVKKAKKRKHSINKHKRAQGTIFQR
jgi:hypothetical protein